MLHVPEHVDFDSPAVLCDCLTHVYGNTADHPHRVRNGERDHVPDQLPQEGQLPVPASRIHRPDQPHPHGVLHLARMRGSVGFSRSPQRLGERHGGEHYLAWNDQEMSTVATRSVPVTMPRSDREAPGAGWVVGLRCRALTALSEHEPDAARGPRTPVMKR